MLGPQTTCNNVCLARTLADTKPAHVIAGRAVAFVYFASPDEREGRVLHV